MNSKAVRCRLPVELYRPILMYLDETWDGRQALLNLLVVSKAMHREVLQVIYKSLVLRPDIRHPTHLNDTTAQMVRSVQIYLGIRQGTMRHAQWCMETLPRLIRLESIEIRGRAWDTGVFEACL